MSTSTGRDCSTPTQPVTDTRHAWIAPAVSRMRAGDAENGPTPNQDDGLFSQGS